MQRISEILGITTILIILPVGLVAEAQLPVIDVANLTQNTTTAANMVINTAKWILELTGLPEVVLASGAFLEDMATLEQLIRDGQMLAWDVASLQAQLTALFALESAPMTSEAYARRMAEIRVVVWQSYSYAMRTQTLIRTLLNTIAHAMTFIQNVVAAVGNLQAGQTIAQATTKLVQLQSELQIQTAAFHRAESMDGIAEPLIEQSLQHINRNVWSKEP